MAPETNVVLSLVYILFLLVPGYLALRGYLDATMKLDAISRIDKIIIAVVAGSITLALVLILNRYNIFAVIGNFWDTILEVVVLLTGSNKLIAVVDFWYVISMSEGFDEQIEYSAENAITLDDASEISALGFLGVMAFQSLLGYIGGYLYGTLIHVRSSRPSRSDEDLEQPWETAVRQSAIGQELTVITRNGDEIKGKLYRIGSPSEDYDLLLSASEKMVVGANPIPLGVTYHHYEDISQVRFPEIVPENPNAEGNWLMKTYSKMYSGSESRLNNVKNTIRGWWGKHYYGFTKSSVYDAVEHANRLSTQLNAEDDFSEHPNEGDEFQ